MVRPCQTPYPPLSNARSAGQNIDSSGPKRTSRRWTVRLHAENAARRFISAIDEFYDRNVNIVVSAAAAPAALYRGERLQLEFLRAASRLIEMQTQQYLAGSHRP